MAVTHPVGVRNSIVDGVVDQLDLGSTNATPRLVFNTSGDVEVATLNFSVTSFGASAVGIATANAIADETNATGGTTTKFRFTDRDNGIIVEGNVGTSGTDIVLSSNVIAATDTVSMSTLTYQGPA